MNRHEFRKSVALSSKIDIHFIKIDFDSLEDVLNVMKLLRTNYRALGHPFGFKVKYSGAVETERGYYMSAYVHMSYLKYMRLCAMSDSEKLQNSCKGWLDTNAPDMLNDYRKLIEQYKYIKAMNIALKNKRDGKNEAHQ